MVIDILENFKDGKRLHPRYIVELIEHAQRIFEREQTVKKLCSNRRRALPLWGICMASCKTCCRYLSLMVFPTSDTTISLTATL